jgi:hypothetical protein
MDVSSHNHVFCLDSSSPFSAGGAEPPALRHFGYIMSESNPPGRLAYALCHSGPRRVRGMHYLTTSLADLLRPAPKLWLLWSEIAVESLANVALGIHRLDPCSMSMTQKYLTDFLRANARSIRTLCFHSVEVSSESYRSGISLYPQSMGKNVDASFQ